MNIEKILYTLIVFLFLQEKVKHLFTLKFEFSRFDLIFLQFNSFFC